MSADRSAVNWALLAIRVVLGVIFMAHGSQKLFGAFGGPGLAAIVGMMGPVGYLVSVGEFFGGLGILVGFLSRFSAASIIVIMLGAIVTVHWQNGFFAPKGFEYPFAVIGLNLPILVAGPGAFTLGRHLPLPRAGDGSRPLAVLE